MTLLNLEEVNEKLEKSTPQEVIKWAIDTFGKELFQSTAFGLTGLVTVDMISKLGTTVDLIFVDTLYHFPQTIELVEKVKTRYSPIKVITYTPHNVSTEAEFVAQYGDQLWETDELKYDFLVKVEPIQRAFRELPVKAVLTGRRRSQGGARDKLPFVEFEKESGVYKINPLCKWSFGDVKEYVDANNVPYNELLDLGYKSIGDWHSTMPVAEGEDERSGRWKGKAKTECGIHQAERFTHLLGEQKV